MTAERRRLAARSTVPEDLAALARLRWFVHFLKTTEGNLPAGLRDRGKNDWRALEHCYGLLEEMLVAGLSPMEEV